MEVAGRGRLANIERERNRYADEGPARVVITFPRLAWFVAGRGASTGSKRQARNVAHRRAS